jgi:hypothetical protein
MNQTSVTQLRYPIIIARTSLAACSFGSKEPALRRATPTARSTSLVPAMGIRFWTKLVVGFSFTTACKPAQLYDEHRAFPPPLGRAA